ncbi:hypothetical protein LXL04_003778 [Taraxacum kok-saghyz]
MHLQARPPSEFYSPRFYSPGTTPSFAGKATNRALRFRPRPPYRLVPFSLCCRFSGRLQQRELPPCSSTVAVISHRDRVVVAHKCCLTGRSRCGSGRMRERTSFATESIGAKPIITTSGHQSPPLASPATTTVAVSSAPIFCYILATWNLFINWFVIIY